MDFKELPLSIFVGGCGFVMADKKTRDHLGIQDGDFVEVQNAEGTGSVIRQVSKVPKDILKTISSPTLFVPASDIGYLGIRDLKETVKIRPSDCTLSIP